ncbi:hypothetical protein HPP92_004800 [Vanilla planifolia]|uniref:Uncharacterized protein n=1 Tax=Vanilla planifolia TaxID=51239 RepID=A0A835RKI0_VANPL|nr:hypothetical protein HPP92_004800 [Vanilla planifolia]
MRHSKCMVGNDIMQLGVVGRGLTKVSVAWRSQAQRGKVRCSRARRDSGDRHGLAQCSAIGRIRSLSTVSRHSGAQVEQLIVWDF